MPFRFQARYGLFTYAQCAELDPFEVVSLFSGLGAECIIGRESHADQGIHLHAFVDFGRKFRTSDERAFDVDGRHPNVSPSRGTPEKGYDYAVKDGDVVAGGLERPIGGRVPQPSIDWGRICDATCEREFWDLVRELAPRAILTNFTSLRAFAEWNFRPDPTIYSTPPGISFDISGVTHLPEWVRDNLAGDLVSKCSLLPVGYGGGPPRGHPTPRGRGCRRLKQ